MILRDFLARLVAKEGEPVDRDSMLRKANELRKCHGPEVLVRRICEEAKPGEKIIIDSVRTVAEAKFLKNVEGFLLAIDAPQEIRFERVKLRKSCTDQVNWKEFCQKEAREMCSTDEGQPSLGEVMKMADVRIQNSGHIDDFYLALRRSFPPRNLCIVGPQGTGKSFLLDEISKGLDKAGRVGYDACKELARELKDEMLLSCLDAQKTDLLF